MNYAQALKSMTNICNGPDCDFNDLVMLTRVVMDNIITVSIFLATVAFMYVGFKYLTSQGDPGAKTYAKKVAFNVVIGLFFVLAGWVIVYTISTVLLKDGFSLLGGTVSRPN